MEILSVPVIAMMVFGLIELIKLPLKSVPNFTNFIPLVSGLLGGILGLTAYFVAPAIIPSSNVFHAILVGGLSGLSATGSHQLVKQIKKISNTNEEE